MQLEAPFVFCLPPHDRGDGRPARRHELALDKNESQPGKVFARIGGHGDQIVEPKRCLLKIAIVSRPFADLREHRRVSHVADEQIIPPAERPGLGNQRAAGRTDVGDLPLELEAISRTRRLRRKLPRPTFLWIAASLP